MDPTPEEVRKSIEPKSDQLNADDLVSGPITVTIEGVRKGDREQPIIIDISNHKPWKPCKTMMRVMVAVWGDEVKTWEGNQATLFCDPEVKWAGVKVGGIRISHLSGLTEPKKLLNTKSRGKRAEITIFPVAADTAQVESLIADIEAAQSMESLKDCAFVIKSKSKAIQDAVRPAYAKRQGELS